MKQTKYVLHRLISAATERHIRGNNVVLNYIVIQLKYKSLLNIAQIGEW